MNKDVVEGRWKEIRGQLKIWWSDLTDDDLDQVDGKADRLIGALQLRYGYAREKARDEVERHLREYEKSLLD